MTIVVNNSTNNNKANGMERSDSVSPVLDIKANATVDLLEQPYGNLERAVQAKLRNLEKRRLKLQQKSEQAAKGVALTNEQRDALTKASEVDQQIEYIKELSKLLEKQQRLYQRARKDALRKQKLLWTEKAVKIDANNATPTPTETENGTAAMEKLNGDRPQMEVNSQKTVEQSIDTTETVDLKPTDVDCAGKENTTVVLTGSQEDANVAKSVEQTLEANGDISQSKAFANGNDQTAAEQIDVVSNGNDQTAAEQIDVVSNGHDVAQQPASDDAQPTENLTDSIADGKQANGINRRPHSNRRSSNPKRDFNGQQGSGPNGKPFHPRGNRYQRSQNGGHPSNSAKNSHAPADVVADSSESEFVKPTIFVRQKNVDGSSAEANEDGQPNGHGNNHPNGHRGHHNNNYRGDGGRSAYRRPNRGNHSPQTDDSNGASLMENGNETIENGQHDGQTARPPRQYANNNGNVYRRPPRQYNNYNGNGNGDGANGNGRPYRSRSGYGNGNSRNYENDNISNNNNGYSNYNNSNGSGKAPLRGNYYKQTANYRQPVEGGFIFAAD